MNKKLNISRTSLNVHQNLLNFASLLILIPYDMLRQMRSLFVRSNRRLKIFQGCSEKVLVELGRSFCDSFYCSYLWTQYNASSFSKFRVAYNDLYRKILHVSRRSSVSEMFVKNNIPNFEALLRNEVYSFTSRFKVSDNVIINCIE